MWDQKLQTVLIDIAHCVEVDSSIYVFTRDSVRIIMPVFVWMNHPCIKFSPMPFSLW